MEQLKTLLGRPTKSYQHIQQEERALIELLSTDGLSSSEIAKKVGRHKSTISRELGPTGANV